MKSPNQIEQDFVVLSPDKRASIEHANSTLYERLDKTYGDFSGHELISCYEFDSDWSNWEIHPHGDEVVVLMSGEVSFILHMEERDTSVKLSEQGQYVIVPKGIWHTAKTDVKSKLLFITPGQATQHKMIE